MTTKVNGFVATPDQFVSGAMAMFTVTSSADIKTVTAGHNVELDKLIAAISMRAQPVLMGAPAGSGPYTLRFAVEHNEVFGDLTAAGTELSEATGATVTLAAFVL
jgi:hypothetical protein